MPFPTEFPSAAAMLIGRAVLARKFGAELLEPAYELQGYAEYMLVDGAAPVPLQRSASATDHSDYEVGRLLCLAGLDGVDIDAGGFMVSSGVSLPWAAVLRVLAKIVEGLLLGGAA
jgi:hypothetical protein